MNSAPQIRTATLKIPAPIRNTTIIIPASPAGTAIPKIFAPPIRTATLEIPESSILSRDGNGAVGNLHQSAILRFFNGAAL